MKVKRGLHHSSARTTNTTNSTSVSSTLIRILFLELPTFLSNVIANIRLAMLACDSSHAHIYALDRLTLGVSQIENEGWKTRALAQEPVGVRRDGSRFIIGVPPKLLGFYVGENSSYEASALGNLVLITVKTKIPISMRGGGVRTTP
jgi:hypothetical protein